MDRSGIIDEISTNPLLSLISSTIKSIDSRLSSVSDVVHHSQDNKKETHMPKPTPAPARRAAAPAAAARPAARAAAPARKAAAPADDFDDFEGFDEEPAAPARGGARKAQSAPADDDFGDFDADGGADGSDLDDGAGDAGDFGDFDEEPAAPARGSRKAAAPADDDFGDFDADGVDGEATDDEGAADFEEAGEGEGDFADNEPEAEEPAPLQPKLRNGEYILPKGSKAWYIGDDGEGGWKRDRTVVDTTRALKVTFLKKEHNYAFGQEDSKGKTWVALGLGKSYIICTTAEQLLDAKTKKPAKILAAAPVEEAAPAPTRGSRKAAPVEDAAPAMPREQVIAVKKFDAAVAELKAAFGIG